jgi:hypothetical protein
MSFPYHLFAHAFHAAGEGLFGGLQEMGPHEQAEALRHRLSQETALRSPIYLNERKVNNVFQQRHENISEVISTNEIGAEISANYLAFGGKGSMKQAASEKVETTPLTKAVLLENVERERGTLIDLANDKPQPGRLLTYVGAGKVIAPWDDISELAAPELGALGVEAVRAKRSDHNRALTLKGGNGATIVWVASGAGPYASIASLEWVDGSALASYLQQQSFGILAMLEDAVAGISLLDPLWIWHQPLTT